MFEYYEDKDEQVHCIIRKEGEGNSSQTFSGTVVKVIRGTYYSEGYKSDGWGYNYCSKVDFTEEDNQSKGETMKKFKVGDKVKVTGEGSHEMWVLGMDKTIDMVGIIDEVSDLEIKVLFGFPISDWWWFHPDNLELLKESKYICTHHKINMFGAGDTLEESFQNIQSVLGDGVNVSDCKFYKEIPVEVSMKLTISEN